MVSTCPPQIMENYITLKKMSKVAESIRYVDTKWCRNTRPSRIISACAKDPELTDRCVPLLKALLESVGFCNQ